MGSSIILRKDPKLGAVRIDHFKFQLVRQPRGRPGENVTTDMPGMVNLPERSPMS
jgi:hypothetical protein